MGQKKGFQIRILIGYLKYNITNKNIYHSPLHFSLSAPLGNVTLEASNVYFQNHNKATEQTKKIMKWTMHLNAEKPIFDPNSCFPERSPEADHSICHLNIVYLLV